MKRYGISPKFDRAPPDYALEFEADTGEDLVAAARDAQGEDGEGLDFFSLSLDMD